MYLTFQGVKDGWLGWLVGSNSKNTDSSLPPFLVFFLPSFFISFLAFLSFSFFLTSN